MKSIYISCILSLVLLFGSNIVLAIPAFPGAEGFGAQSIGGRGGTVYEVNNLNDSGPGSLRAAVEASGPRTVIFRVSGTIALQSTLQINNPYITIAGQTAPGDGICLKDYPFIVAANDVIVRYIRVRLGDNIAGNEWDSVNLLRGWNIILDHCSASWSVDETLSAGIIEGSINTMGNLTVQWCIISESLKYSVHPKGKHGYGSLIRGDSNNGYTYHHNLYAHHSGRSPRPGNYLANTIDPCGLIFDFRNNVVYNWGGSYAGYNADGSNGVPSITKMNFVGNYYKRGVNSSSGSYAFSETTKTSKAYFNGNWMQGANPPDPWSLVTFSGTWTAGEEAAYKQSSPIPVAPVTTDDALTAYLLVMDEAGASFPVRDAVDERIVNDVNDITGQIIDCEESGNFYYPTGYARAGTSTKITLATTASNYDDAYNSHKIEILAGMGAGQIRTISDYVGSTRVATISTSWSTIPDTTSQYGVIIDCTKNGGGWPVLASGTPPADNDHDGMPNAWEMAMCLDPNNASDANDYRSDGYTNIEAYINWLPSGEPMPANTDLNCDSIVNFYDFTEFAQHWSASYGEPLYSGRYDFSHNDVISMDDLFYIAQDWLTAGQEY